MLRARLHTDLSCRIGVYLCLSVAPKICQRIYETIYLGFLGPRRKRVKTS
jgi:hypothetical protein